MTDVVPLRLTPPHALKMIRELAAESSKIFVVRHAEQRAAERRITRRQIESCLRKGVITEGPFMNQHGNWQVTLQRHGAGEMVNCVVAIEWARRLIVVTVYQ